MRLTAGPTSRVKRGDELGRRQLAGEAVDLGAPRVRNPEVACDGVADRGELRARRLDRRGHAQRGVGERARVVLRRPASVLPPCRPAAFRRPRRPRATRARAADREQGREAGASLAMYRQQARPSAAICRMGATILRRSRQMTRSSLQNTHESRHPARDTGLSRCYLPGSRAVSPQPSQGARRNDSDATTERSGRSLRPYVRARRVRRRLRRAAERRAVARDGEPGDRRPREPRAPRRRGRRSQHRRRCRDPPADARRADARADRGPAAAGRLRRLRVLPPAGRGAAGRARGAARADGAGRGPARRGLAGHPGRQGLRRHHRQLLRAVHQAADRRRRGPAGRRPGRLRAQAVRDPPGGRDRRRAGARDPVLLLADARVQGDAHVPAGARLLPRPAGPPHEVRARARPLALLHEHLPELGARPPVPDDRPQRRDQHAARQRQLDAGARVAAGVRAVRRRPAEGAAGRAPRRVGLGDVRQRARAAHAGRPQPPARGDDDDPGGVRGPRRPARAPARLLRLPLVPDGAVGRPGGGRLHRRPRDRRDARPQRAAPRPLAGDQGRLGRARLGDRGDGRRARRTSCARAGCSPASCSSSTSSAAASSRTARSSARSRRGSRTRSGSSRASCTCPTSRPASPRTAARRTSSRCSSRSATRRRTSRCCWRRPRRAPRSRSARWATTSRWPCSATATRRSSPTSSSSSRRSRTRRSTRSARRS